VSSPSSGHRQSLRRRTALSAATLGALLAVAGCGGGGSNQGSPPPRAVRSGAVTIAGFKFQPATLRVSRGTKLRFTNRDDAQHTATADGGAFDTGTLKKGAVRTVTLRKVGSYSYHCAFHPFMTGRVVVH
jgi:plastocyanin